MPSSGEQYFSHCLTDSAGIHCHCPEGCCWPATNTGMVGPTWTYSKKKEWLLTLWLVWLVEMISVWIPGLILHPRFLESSPAWALNGEGYEGRSCLPMPSYERDRVHACPNGHCCTETSGVTRMRHVHIYSGIHADYYILKNHRYCTVSNYSLPTSFGVNGKGGYSVPCWL